QEFSDRPLVVLGRDLTSRHNDTKRTVLVRAVVPNPVELDAGVSPNGFSFVDERALARGGEFVRCGEADLEDSRGLDVRFAGRVGDSPAESQHDAKYDHAVSGYCSHSQTRHHSMT